MTDWRLGSYHLHRKLGEGGMAQVYLARDVRLDREVAVKVLDRKLADRPGFRERFMREAKLAALLDHPNIVPLYDFGDEDALYLVMPYLSGGSLQDLLPRTPLQAGEVVTYGSQIADALDYAHQRKVVHRDVKPANMLLHADGRLMLSDFGLAKIVSQTNTPNAPRNRPDAGTPEYMAPEQVVGSSDARSDIYGLGVVLYLLLTGRLPFTGASSQEVMQAHLHKPPPPPRRYNASIPPAMEAVVLRAMAKQPDERFQRASELGAALLGALIAGESPEHFSFSSAPSSASRPTGIAPIVPFGGIPSRGQLSDRPGDALPWRQGSSAGQGSFGATYESGAELFVPGGADVASHPSSSINGLLPDLNTPFTSLAEPGPLAGPDMAFPMDSGVRPGQRNSFVGPRGGVSGAGSSQITDQFGGQYAGGPAGRATSRPVSHFQASAPGVAQAQAPARTRATSAPYRAQIPLAAQVAPVIEPTDPRVALPGSRMTNPPSAPAPHARSSRLWIVIAMLLIIMLFAAIALLRYLQITQAATLH